MGSWSLRLPGIVLVVAVAVAAWVISRLVPWLPAAPLALALGWVVAFLISQRLAVEHGVAWSGTRALRLGVMLLGAQLSLAVIVDQGLEAVPLIVLVLAIVFAAAELGGRWLGLPSAMRIVMGAGIGICGNSAIAAVSPVLRATQQQVATGVAMITVFGTVAVLVYPVVGAWLNLSPDDYGRWTGIAIADTAQVVAAGFAGGPDAGEVATITKLTRNAFLGPVVLVIAALAARSADHTSARLSLWAAVPPFVLGFLLLATLRSVGLIGESLGDVLATLGGFAILVGLAGIGYALHAMRPGRADIRALALGLAIMISISVAMLLVVVAT